MNIKAWLTGAMRLYHFIEYVSLRLTRIALCVWVWRCHGFSLRGATFDHIIWRLSFPLLLLLAPTRPYFHAFQSCQKEQPNLLLLSTSCDLHLHRIDYNERCVLFCRQRGSWCWPLVVRVRPGGCFLRPPPLIRRAQKRNRALVILFNGELF
jgi:hypothetical protein